MDCFYQELEKFSILDNLLEEIEVPENLDKKTGHKLLKQIKEHQASYVEKFTDAIRNIPSGPNDTQIDRSPREMEKLAGLFAEDWILGKHKISALQLQKLLC